MLLKVNCEFRGKSERTNDNGTYIYANLEDENGESAKFQVNDNVDLSKFKKGDKVLAYLEYNVKFGSLKVFSIEVK